MSTVLRAVELTGGSARDVKAIDALMQAAFDPKYGEAWTQGQCLGVLALPGVWLTLAHASDQNGDGATVGFAMARAILDEAELLLIATHPDARRQGVGAALLRATIDAARERGVAKLHLEVRAGNPATGLYAGHGFAKVGERRAYYRGKDGAQRDAHTYALML